jgi:SAM-dependent MidA family methyltransferase
MQLQLPEPTPDALAASRALHALIADTIRRNDGWISFAQYMEQVLYAPGLGYYSGGAAKLGKDGDFTTAPEITPLFGATLARVAADLFAQTGPRILEFGAGTGKLARDMLTEWQHAGIALESYAIVELSGELRARQQENLRGFPQVRWLDRLPESFAGVAIGNEVLDAMPVNLVVKTARGWQERGVGLAQERLVFADRPCASTLAAQVPDAEDLPDGYLSEVHPLAQAFIRSLASTLQAGGRGAAILIDYGFPAREYYHPQRSQGTLMCHYRHHAHPDPFYLPGLQDVTAHVDFSAMATTALDAGLELLGYASQAAFLLDAGIGELLLRTSPDDSLQYLPQANAMQKLISPAEMGELFKVLTLGTGVALPPAFARNDRSHRL